jgi:hypothetical protein
MFKRRIRIVSLVVAALVALAVPAAADEGTEVDDGGIGAGGTIITGLLEAEFGITSEEAVAWNEAGVGWGALFKLGIASAITGNSIDDLLASAVLGEDGEYEYGFSWGEWFRSLDEEQLATLEGMSRNLGQLISAERRGHGRPDHAVGPQDKGDKPDKADKPGRPDKPGESD